MRSRTSISSRSRHSRIAEMANETFDVLVIGGGITGAGVASAAAQRGLRVALVEASDFAAGTSSRSSKLIHGGLRYLAMADFGLVRETARERVQVYRRAPHLAEPRIMLLPMRSLRERLWYGLGLAIYDRLGAVSASDWHRPWGPDELAREEPVLARSRYPRAFAYREYLTDDARLVLANLRQATGRGASVLNYARVDALAADSGGFSRVRVRCPLDDVVIDVRARCVVNAAGPWVEAVQHLEGSGGRPWLHLSKGVHVVLPWQRLPLRHMVALGTRDDRILFAIPRGSVVYVGTTDTTHAGGPELWPEITRADVEYLLEPLDRYFDIAPVRPDEVVAAWAGLRPLIAEPGKSPSEMSRRDEVVIGESGLVSVAGGKLTGYRVMARQVLQAVGKVLDRDLVAAPRRDGSWAGADRTTPESLPGGDFDGNLLKLAEGLAAPGLSSSTCERLARLYGSEAPAVLAMGDQPLASSGAAAGSALAPVPAVTGEVNWAVCVEGACHLEDVIYRRTRLALYEPRAHEILVAAAERLGGVLGWDRERRQTEIEAVQSQLEHDLCFDSRSPTRAHSPSAEEKD